MLILVLFELTLALDAALVMSCALQLKSISLDETDNIE